MPAPLTSSNDSKFSITVYPDDGGKPPDRVSPLRLIDVVVVALVVGALLLLKG
jgi:hypothetical protein